MRFLLFLITFFSYTSYAQVIVSEGKKIKPEHQDTLVIDSGDKDSLKIFKPTLKDYNYFTRFSEKKPFDSTFTIEKSYIYSQYNNKDNFGKVPFANNGAGFQPLVYEVIPEQFLQLLPTNKSFGIFYINDIRYYDVKTPTTTFIYHNAMRNGGELQSTYTQNIGKTFNFAIEYQGLRSQGLYNRSLSSSNNTIFSGHFLSKNKKYEFFAHYIHQNINSEENGGISDLSLFLGGDKRFDNRLNLAVNLGNSDSRFSYRRYYFSHEFTPFDPEKYPFRVRHTIYHQGNKYYFIQNNLEPYYSTGNLMIPNSLLTARKFSENLSNTISLLFDKEKFKLEAGIRYQNLKFGINDVLISALPNLPKVYSENRFGAVGNLKIKLWQKFDISSNAEYSNGKSFGNQIIFENTASFEPAIGYKAEAFLNLYSSAPGFNFLMNYSPIANFNYDFTGFKNQSTLEMGGKIQLKYFNSNVFLKQFRIENYTYIDQNHQPQQSSSSVNISQLGGEATFDYHHFHLNSRVLFQSTLTNKNLFPTPNFIGRFALYWQDKAFKNAAELQAGIKVYYLTRFASREYFPVLNEFALPGTSGYPIGGQPIADVFFNMKVKRMYFFIEGQQITTTFSQNKSFTAPYYPIYDFRLNLGIVWYLFQ